MLNQLSFKDAPSKFEIPAPPHVPTRVLFGRASLDCLGSLLARAATEHRVRRFLLITGRRTPAKPWLNPVFEACDAYPRLHLVNEVSNPTIDSIEAHLAAARRGGVDAVVAVGGGSVIDTAKAVAALARTEMSVREALERKGKAFPALPLLAVPTTFGTGSEVTPSATIWDDRARTKHSLASPDLFPETAVVDPDTMPSLPAHLIAGTGLDALAHAMEAAWSVNADAPAVDCAIEATRLVARNLAAAVRDPFDAARREALAKGSLFAGFAIAKGQTTIAHAISYSLTARWGVHHGHACGLSLGELLRFNAAVSERDCLHPRGVGHVQGVIARLLAAIGAPSVAAGARFVEDLIRRMGLRSFDQFDEFEVERIVADAVAYDRFRNNPRRMDESRLREFVGVLAAPRNTLVPLEAREEKTRG